MDMGKSTRSVSLETFYWLAVDKFIDLNKSKFLDVSKAIQHLIRKGLETEGIVIGDLNLSENFKVVKKKR